MSVCLGGFLLVGPLVATAFAHSAFLGSLPEPGARLAASPPAITLTFTEPLIRPLTNGSLIALPSGETVPTIRSADHRQLTLRPVQPLPRGAYRLQWHSVSTTDGHALEGSFSFGVRAAAAGTAHTVAQSPLARDGWLRVTARALMYGTLLVFVGSLLLGVLLGRRGRSWLVPVSLQREVGANALRASRREQVILADLGFVAAAAAALSAIADTSDATGGLSVGDASDYLLTSQAGVGRVAVVALLLIAALAARRPRLAVFPAVCAVGALAMSGHANSASPRALALIVDWLHVLAVSVWIGGIVPIVAVWSPTLRHGSTPQRLSVARNVLPVFGRVALPAFAVVAATGLVSAAVELGDASALWHTDYGLVLAFKAELVLFIAAASYLHAFRLRPRLLSNPDREKRIESRHWRLLRAEPLLALSVVFAVALLAAFPLPPQQLRQDDAVARAAGPVCDPCPLPRPQRRQLAVAEQGGSNVVAAWIRKAGNGLAGTVRVYTIDRKPAAQPFEIMGASQSKCGPGCARFTTTSAPPYLVVGVRESGHRYFAALDTRWRPGSRKKAHLILDRAQKTMRDLRTVREIEQTSSSPSLTVATSYRFKAPDRFAYRTDGGSHTIVIDKTRWDRTSDDEPWQKSEFGGGFAFRTRPVFSWTNYARYAYWIGVDREAGRRVDVVATMDPGTPVWWRLYIDRRTHRVLRARMITNGHFMNQRFYAFNRPLELRAPKPASTNGR